MDFEGPFHHHGRLRIISYQRYRRDLSSSDLTLTLTQRRFLRLSSLPPLTLGAARATALSEEGLPRGNLLPPGPGHPATSRLLRCSHPSVSGASQPPSTFPFYFRTMMFRTCSQLAPHGAPPLHHHRPAPSSQPHHISPSLFTRLTVSHIHRWPALGD